MDRYFCCLVHDSGDNWSWQYYSFLAESEEEAKKKMAPLGALMDEAPHALFRHKKSDNSQMSITDDELRAISKFSEEMKNVSRDELAQIVSGFTYRGTEGDIILWGVDASGNTYMRHEFTEGGWKALSRKHKW